MTSQKAMGRFLRNKPAVAGLLFITLASLVSLFGRVIAPDKSPFANTQILEIADEKPGFSKDFLPIKHATSTPCSFFTLLAKGCPSTKEFIPLDDYEIRNDSIFIQHYQGQGRFATSESYALAETGNLPVVRKRFLLGTDRFGRDLWSRILMGTRVSLLVGLVAVLLSLLLGISLGATSGYYGGRLDAFIMWLANVIWSLPTILLAMAIAFALRGAADAKVVLFIAIGFSMWVDVARLVRGQVLSVKEEPYVQAATALGASTFRIITKHILPNIIGPIMVIAAANFAAAVLIEAGLSFIGIGISPPEPSWGTLLNENKAYLFTRNNALMALAPGFAIMLLVMSFNLLGNGLRDAFDVKG